MMLPCSIFIEDNEAPNRSFKRFVYCNLHLGLPGTSLKVKSGEPCLCIVTAMRTLKYKISNNVKQIINKQLIRGKICIEFFQPSHSIMIRCDSGKLSVFLRLFEKISDHTKLAKLATVPVIPTNLKFIPKSHSNTTGFGVKEIISKVKCIPLRNELLKNVNVLNLTNCNIKNIPMQLGFLQWTEINLASNNLCDEDLSWLEGMPVRQTLGTLNLSKNQITSFPSALVDFYRLTSLNLRDNLIQHIPGGIGSLQSLRYLNLSNNKIRSLPASVVYMKLNELDLTQNHLFCNDPIKDLPEGEDNCNCPLPLVDIAALKINSILRRQLSTKDCPPRLLEKIRCSSLCVCEKPTAPSVLNQYFVILKSVKFASSYCIHPQKFDQQPLSENIFLQYHFCSRQNKCDSKKFRMIQSQLSCFRLL